MGYIENYDPAEIGHLLLPSSFFLSPAADSIINGNRDVRSGSEGLLQQ